MAVLLSTIYLYFACPTTARCPLEYDGQDESEDDRDDDNYKDVWMTMMMTSIRTDEDIDDDVGTYDFSFFNNTFNVAGFINGQWV